MKDSLKECPNASKAEVARQSGRGINTVVRYWDILQGKAKLQPNARKANLQGRRAEAVLEARDIFPNTSLADPIVHWQCLRHL